MHRQKKYLILGGAGLVGSTFARTVAKQGATVTVVDLPSKLSEREFPDGIRKVEADILVPGFLDKLVQKEEPSIILNTVNLATIFSGNEGEGYNSLISFYTRLYEVLSHVSTPLHYVQAGTTGSGGLGFNIPFTHGENLEHRPIIHKAAFSGITSQLLVMLSRSFPEGNIRVSELKPGLAIFDDTFHQSKIAGATCVTLDGGESGHYTYNEVALLMKMMGFTTASMVVEKIMGIITSEKGFSHSNGYDLTAAMNRAIVSEGRSDSAKRKKILDEMKKRQGKYNVIATGNLGPRSITASLLQAYMRLNGVTMLDPDPSVRATLAYLAQKDIALAEYVEKCCQQLPPIEPSREQREPWQLVM